ncbi:MAG TPA: adenylate kinase [Thermoplasmata archaeon]|nr:adenylate kinase [Thermoplasmata archaeon]
MRAIISGIPGAGKTTVLNEMLKILSFEVINYGDVMFNMAKEYGIKDRDEMRKLPYSKQIEIQKRAAEKISEKDNVIIDTHCTIKTPYGYMPGLPYNILKILKPERIILIEANPDEIEKRREKDKDIRERDEESIEEMRLHQLMNRISAMSYAVLIGATVKIIENRQGKLKEAVNELVKTLRE